MVSLKRVHINCSFVSNQIKFLSDQCLWPCCIGIRPLTLLYCDCTNGWSHFRSPMCYTGLRCTQYGWIWTGKMKLPSRRLFLIMRKFTSTYPISIFERGKRCCRLRPFSARRRRLTSYRHSKCQLHPLSSLIGMHRAWVAVGDRKLAQWMVGCSEVILWCRIVLIMNIFSLEILEM